MNSRFGNGIEADSETQKTCASARKLFLFWQENVTFILDISMIICQIEALYPVRSSII